MAGNAFVAADAAVVLTWRSPWSFWRVKPDVHTASWMFSTWPLVNEFAHVYLSEYPKNASAIRVNLEVTRPNVMRIRPYNLGRGALA